MKNKVYLLFIISIATIVIAFLYLETKSRIDVLIEKTQNIHISQINSAIHQYKSSNKFIFDSIINDDEVLVLQKKALENKDEEHRAIYRDALYQKLDYFYMHLKEYGIKQLHFHFPDATSFLRFHKPKQFGDNLKDIRYSIVVANRDLKPVFGFEEGRIFNGYRLVYPIFYKKEHIGSVEISIGFDAINKISLQNYHTYQYIILNKDVVEGKVFSGEKKNYDKSLVNDHFYHEVNSFSNYKKGFTTNKKILTLDNFEKINKQLKKEITTESLLQYKHIVKFIKIDGLYYFASLLPINNIQNKNIGYIISFGSCACVQDMYNELYLKIILVSLVLLVVFFYLFKQSQSNKELEKLTKIANEERDKAMASSKAKAEFLANMSHEIRTPLNAVIGFIDILKEENKGRKAEKYVDIIKSSTIGLLEIIEDILDFSKIESGKLEIEKIDFNVKNELSVISNIFEGKCFEKNIDFSLEFDKNIPEIINTDLFRLKQVLLNLVSNAVKFTPNGEKIRVNIGYEEKALTVSVLDNGIGVSKDKQKHIFEVFNQEDSSTTRRFGGTGLGLSISYELVKLLGGELKLHSEVGIGSEFYFVIPITLGDKISKQLEETTLIDTFHSQLVLVVEDNPSNQMLMEILLKKLNLQYEIASDGLIAINKFKQKKYDIVLMDENMPNMNGIEAAKNILEYENENNLQHTPIIALTANALNGDRERFMEAGMDEYLSKPINLEKLKEVLSRFLDNKYV